MSDLKYQRRSAVDTSAVSDRVVLFERESRRTIVLNPAGTALWHTMARPCTARDLAAQLQSLFPALTPEQADLDVETYLTELLGQQLIQNAT